MGLLTQANADLGSVFYDTDRGFALTATHVSSGNTFPTLIESPYYENDAGGSLRFHGREIGARIRKSDADTIGIAVGDTMTVSIDGSATTLEIARLDPNGYNEFNATLRQV